MLGRFPRILVRLVWRGRRGCPLRRRKREFVTASTQRNADHAGAECVAAIEPEHAGTFRTREHGSAAKIRASQAICMTSFPELIHARQPTRLAVGVEWGLRAWFRVSSSHLVIGAAYAGRNAGANLCQ